MIEIGKLLEFTTDVFFWKVTNILSGTETVCHAVHQSASTGCTSLRTNKSMHVRYDFFGRRSHCSETPTILL